MLEGYERLSLNNFIDAHPESKLLFSVLRGKGVVADLLDEGCYIAGGFGRILLRGDSVDDYLSIRSSRPAGDIDIFFDDASKAEAHRKAFKSAARSFGGNALESFTKSGRAQLVDSEKLILPMEEQLHRFDFTNACVAITRDHIYVNSKFKDIEKSNLLDVKNNASPFLGSRIMKYFKYRGIKSVTPESETLITEWIMRATCNSFGFHDTINQVEIRGLEHNIQALLREKNLTRADDLLLVLGRFKEKHTTKYGPVIETDFALSQLKERGYEVTVPAV